jgi:hypothetical protein
MLQRTSAARSWLSVPRTHAAWTLIQVNALTTLISMRLFGLGIGRDRDYRSPSIKRGDIKLKKPLTKRPAQGVCGLISRLEA